MYSHTTLAVLKSKPVSLTKALWCRFALGGAALALAACGGGSGSAPPDSMPASVAISGVPNAGFGSTGTADFRLEYDVERYRFSWSATPEATHYELYEDPDGPGPQPEAMVGDAVTGTSQIYEINQLHERVNAIYRLRACNGSSCTFKATTLTPDATKAHFFFKPDGSTVLGTFDTIAANKVRLSKDLKTLVVGAPQPVNTIMLPRPTPAIDDSAVYVFVRSATNEAWQPQARLQASNLRAPACNNKAQDYCQSSSFGGHLALSADGNTLAVSATGETSNARGVNGDQANTDSLAAGAVYVFTRTNGAWNQQAYIKSSNTPALNNTWCQPLYWTTLPCNEQYFGISITLSADGNLLAVGAPGESSKSIGINGDQTDTSAPGAGAAYIYTRSGSTWTHQTYLKASNTEANDGFGGFLTLSGDGSTLAVSAKFEGSSATGINGDQLDNSDPVSGAVYVFSQSNGAWNQQAYVKAAPKIVGPDRYDKAVYFGGPAAFSHDGNTLAVGRSGGGTPGAIHVFTRSSQTWKVQAHMQAKVTAPDVRNGDFVEGLGLSADGNTLATIGMDRGPNFPSRLLYLFTRINGAWGQ